MRNPVNIIRQETMEGCRNYTILLQEGYQLNEVDNLDEYLKQDAEEQRVWIIECAGLTLQTLTSINKVRRRTAVGSIIVLSRHPDEQENRLLLDMGADAILQWPFQQEELLEQVKVGIAKRKREDGKSIPRVRIQGYVIDAPARTVRHGEGGPRLRLSTKEFDLLSYLVTNRGVALSRDRLLDALWEYGSGPCDRAVDNMVRQLRRKMPLLRIETLYGFGYRLSTGAGMSSID